MNEVISLFSEGETWVSLLTLSLMEIVLGIDNIIFISIVAARLPLQSQERARKLGLLLALLIRIGLLFGISWLVGLTNPLFHIFGQDISVRDLILLAGGLFLISKSTREIHNKLEGESEDTGPGRKVVSFSSVIIQILILDVIFSFDSIITAVGLVDHVSIMIVAVIISMVVMIMFSRKIAEFIHKHPSMKILALSFLIMIGFLLVVEAFEVHVSKGYVYFAIAFSLIVEVLNMRLRKKTIVPVELREPFTQLRDMEADPQGEDKI